MKKSILIICAVLMIFGLTAFSFTSWDNEGSPMGVDKGTKGCQITGVNNYLTGSFYEQINSPFVYNVDSRFIHTVTKEQLHNATSIVEILPEDATEFVEVYDEIKVAILKGDDEVHEKGKNEMLNASQLSLLKTADYSTDFYITAVYKKKNGYTGKLQGDYLTYYITVVPEKEAEFIAGHEALISYLKENSRGKTSIVNQEELKSGKVSFIVTQEGSISDVKLTSTSGYEEVDLKMVKLISSLPGEWYPATNENGEKVNQEFVFSFGLDGC